MGGSESKIPDPEEIPTEGTEGGTAAPPVTDVPVKPPPTKPIGLDNYGNTCYINSVTQLMFHAIPLREAVLRYATLNADGSGNPNKLPGKILTKAGDLYTTLRDYDKKTYYGPSSFVTRLKEEFFQFNNGNQQDAHELWGCIINNFITDERTALKLDNKTPTPIQRLFEGKLSSETFCVECETKSTRSETFLDLSLEVEPNMSVVACLRSFSSPEIMRGTDKFRCDKCCANCCARRSLRVVSAPQLLLVHLKRFKFVEERGTYRKIGFRVSVPMILGLHVPAPQKQQEANKSGNGKEDASPVEEPLGAGGDHVTVLYDLRGFVVHQGAGPNMGHYYSIIRTNDGGWCRFDDRGVIPISERDVSYFFGVPQASDYSTTSTAYMLLYEKRDAQTV